MYRAIPSFVLAVLLSVIAGSAVAQEQIPWITDLRQARQLAEQQQRLVLLHFWSDSCPPCRALEQNVFNQPELIRVLATSFIPVKINVLEQPKYAEFYKIDRVPTDILVDHTGRELYRATSPQNMNAYLAMLDEVRAQAGVHGAKAAEQFAQSKLQQFSSGLPRMSNGIDEPADSVSINANPESTGEQAEPWRTASNTAGYSGSQQPSPIQNQYDTHTGTPPCTMPPVADPSRLGNPYVQASTTSSPAEPTSGLANSERPWETRPPNDGSTPGIPPQSSPSPSNFQTPSSGAQQQNVWKPDVAQSEVPTQGQFNPSVGQFGQNAPQPPAVAPLPANVPPLAMEGYCPVTLVSLSKWVKGDPRWGAIHRGRTYLLGSQADQQRFLADPDRFSPALSGYDPVRFAETGQLVEGKREHGLFLTNSYYLFADEGALSRFESQPHGYVNVVRQAMANARPNMPQR